MKVLAHIREQYSLSLGSYGRPRMTMELKEAGLVVGERRVGRLMMINGIRPVRTRKHKVTTNSNHRLGIAATGWTAILLPLLLTKNGQATSPTYGLPRVGSTSLLFLIYTAAVSLAGRSATE